MHICFLVLLAALAQAAPFQETPKLHKLVLRRTPTVRDGEVSLTVLDSDSELTLAQHHLIAFQRHLNSAAKRHARMTGVEEPSTAELHGRMVKRVSATNAPQGHD